MLIPPSCPADSSSALPLPVRWQPTRKFCFATRPPARWIRRPPTPFFQLIRDINRKTGHHRHHHHPPDERGGGDLQPGLPYLTAATVAEEGAVGDVFSSPKSEAAQAPGIPGRRGGRDGVRSRRSAQHIRVDLQRRRRCRYAADRQAWPWKSTLLANILSVPAPEPSKDKAYGNMLLGISGDDEYPAAGDCISAAGFPISL